MANKMKLLKIMSQFQGQRVGLMLVGCFLASMAFLSMSKPYNISLPLLSLKLSLHVPTSLKAENSMNSKHLGGDLRQSNATKADVIEKSSRNSTTTHLAYYSSREGRPNKTQERSYIPGGPSSNHDEIDVKIELSRNSSKQLDADMSPRSKLQCDISDPRSDHCEIDGDIRIHGNSSTVTLVTSSQINESYRIKPYARKEDNFAMDYIREVLVRSDDKFSQCTLNHTIPAIIFSVSGYAGNLFHDFTDVIIPLFLTAHEYNGEVQFLVTNMNYPWWVHKYQLLLQNLSNYQVIDFDKDNQIHCFPRVIVGLRSDKELSIDPSRSPNGYSMPDFARFMRRSYSLERDTVSSSVTKPRLLIVSRKRTRAFTNVDEIVELARGLGYEPVVVEPQIGSDVARFARIVNSCDVMMGVHGAGLTNLVFLPANAAVIQIVPWGGLGGVARYDFGEPAKDMGLNYLQYEISEEESSLIEVYPRDHPVFKDPLSFHKLGWNTLKAMFMDKQNVRLDVKRFRAVLVKAFELVHQYKSG